jgi:hypothetical protein
VRVSGTWNLSAKFRHGSGFPHVGFFRRDAAGDLFLGERRNDARTGAYSRLDLRANKTWIFRAWKLTAFAEVLNVLDHDNRRFGAFDVDSRTTQVFFDSDKLFPRLPSIGLTADF